MSGKQKKISVFGFYGQNNFGDDLFCYVINEFCRRHGFSPFFVNARKPQFNNAFTILGFAWKRNRIGTVARIVNNILAVLLADIVMFGGGSVFGKYASFKQRSIVVWLSSLLRKPIFAMGVSLGPYASLRERAAYIELFSKFSFLAVRDDASLRACDISSAKVENIGDMVFALPQFFPREENSSSGFVISIHCGYDVEKLIRVIKGLPPSMPISLIGLDSESNERMKFLHGALKSMGVNCNFEMYDGDFLRVVKIIYSAEYVFTSKLHGAITACAYNVPFYLMQYQEKCTELLRELQIEGFHEQSFDEFTSSGQVSRDWYGINKPLNLSKYDDFFLRMK